jgi:hypothetical protein
MFMWIKVTKEWSIICEDVKVHLPVKKRETQPSSKKTPS